MAWLAAARIGAVSVPAQHLLHQRRAGRAPARGGRRRAAGGRVVPVPRLPGSPPGRHPRARPRGAPAADGRGGAVAAAHRLRPRRDRRPGRRPRLDHGRAAGRRAGGRRRRAGRGRGRRHPGRPDGDRAHLGLDQRAEGRDPRPRPADPPPRQPQRAAPLRPRGGAVLQLAVLLGRGRRLRPARHARGRGHARVLQRADRRGRARRAGAGAADDGQRVRRLDRPPARGPQLPRPGPVVDPPREPLPDHAGGGPPGRPRPPPRDARHDRGGQRVPGQRGRGRPARAPPGLVRPAGHRHRGPGAPGRRRRGRRSASCASGGRS